MYAYIYFSILARLEIRNGAIFYGYFLPAMKATYVFLILKMYIHQKMKYIRILVLYVCMEPESRDYYFVTCWKCKNFIQNIGETF